MSQLSHYLNLARQALELQNQEEAENYVQSALQEPGGLESPEALEVTAQLFSYSGDFDSAKECLNRAVENDKESLGREVDESSTINADEKDGMVRRLLALGELNEGSDSLELYNSALAILEQRNMSDNSQKEQMSLISCSIAELFLSVPLCDDPKAQEKCLQNIEKALNFDSKNVDAWSLKTSYFISSEDQPAAKRCLEKALNIFDQEEKNRQENIKKAEEKAAAGPFGDNSEEPNLDISCNLTHSQITRLIQLSTELGNYEKAISLGESITNYDKTQYRVWYYMAWAGFLSKNEELLDDTRQYLKECKDLLISLKKLKEFSADEIGLLQHVNEMIEETGGALPEIDISGIKDEEVEASLEVDENGDATME